MFGRAAITLSIDPHSSLVSGINSLLLTANLIPFTLSLTHFFLSRRLPLLFHHSQHPPLLHSLTPVLKPTCFTNPSHCRLSVLPQDLLRGLSTTPFLLIAISVFVLVVFRIFPCFWLRSLD